MDHQSPIERYLVEVDRELRLPAVIGVETVLVISGYAILGRYLGLRPTRNR